MIHLHPRHAQFRVPCYSRVQRAELAGWQAAMRCRQVFVPESPTLCKSRKRLFPQSFAAISNPAIIALQLLIRHHQVRRRRRPFHLRVHLLL